MKWRIGANQNVTVNLFGEEPMGRWAKCGVLDSSGYCVLKNSWHAVVVSVKGDQKATRNTTTRLKTVGR